MTKILESLLIECEASKVEVFANCEGAMSFFEKNEDANDYDTFFFTVSKSDWIALKRFVDAKFAEMEEDNNDDNE